MLPRGMFVDPLDAIWYVKITIRGSWIAESQNFQLLDERQGGEKPQVRWMLQKDSESKETTSGEEPRTHK